MKTQVQRPFKHVCCHRSRNTTSWVATRRTNCWQPEGAIGNKSHAVPDTCTHTVCPFLWCVRGVSKPIITSPSVLWAARSVQLHTKRSIRGTCTLYLAVDEIGSINKHEASRGAEDIRRAQGAQGIRQSSLNPLTGNVSHGGDSSKR